MEKLEQLHSWFEGKDSVLVALSGGVDSALVAHAAFSVLGDSAIAVTADYKTLSFDELSSARRVAAEIGILHTVITYNELENPDFVKNDKNRCFHCRTELAEHLLEIARSRDIANIVDGTHHDDLGDYRPGIAALQNNGIKSPLLDLRLSKDEIRSIAKHLDISIYDKPSNSCLASRVPWGQTITSEQLVRIDLAERFVKQTLAIKQIRIRDINGLARIEVPAEDISLVKKNKTVIFDQLRLFGFSSFEIDPDGYHPGKLNVIVD